MREKALWFVALCSLAGCGSDTANAYKFTEPDGSVDPAAPIVRTITSTSPNSTDDDVESEGDVCDPPCGGGSWCAAGVCVAKCDECGTGQVCQTNEQSAQCVAKACNVIGIATIYGHRCEMNIACEDRAYWIDCYHTAANQEIECACGVDKDVVHTFNWPRILCGFEYLSVINTQCGWSLGPNE